MIYIYIHNENTLIGSLLPDSVITFLIFCTVFFDACHITRMEIFITISEENVSCFTWKMVKKLSQYIQYDHYICIILFISL